MGAFGELRTIALRGKVLAWSMSGLPAKAIPRLLSGIGAGAAEDGLTRSLHLPARNVRAHSSSGREVSALPAISRSCIAYARAFVLSPA